MQMQVPHVRKFLLLHMKLGFLGHPIFNMYVIPCSLLSLPFNHNDAVNPSFKCPEQNDYSEFVKFPSVVKTALK